MGRVQPIGHLSSYVSTLWSLFLPTIQSQTSRGPSRPLHLDSLDQCLDRLWGSGYADIRPLLVGAKASNLGGSGLYRVPTVRVSDCVSVAEDRKQQEGQSLPLRAEGFGLEFEPPLCRGWHRGRRWPSVLHRLPPWRAHRNGCNAAGPGRPTCPEVLADRLRDYLCGHVDSGLARADAFLSDLVEPLASGRLLAAWVAIHRPRRNSRGGVGLP